MVEFPRQAAQFTFSLINHHISHFVRFPTKDRSLWQLFGSFPLLFRAQIGFLPISKNFVPSLPFFEFPIQPIKQQRNFSIRTKLPPTPHILSFPKVRYPSLEFNNWRRTSVGKTPFHSFSVKIRGIRVSNSISKLPPNPSPPYVSLYLTLQ